MTPTADDFHALARSSPWRWTTLHLEHTSGALGQVEAWVRRPGELLVREPGGAEHRVSGVPYTRAIGFALVADDSGFVPPPPPPEPVPPQRVEPGRRPDGLVAERPSSIEVEYGDPTWGNYSWVAMLDPVELSHDVALTDVRAGERRGRPTWEARAAALEEYDPRCGCCPLLRSEVSDRHEYADDAGAWTPPPGLTYPTAYDVALDVQTGVVVRCLPVGGSPQMPWLENDILAVDTDIDAVLD